MNAKDLLSFGERRDANADPRSDPRSPNYAKHWTTEQVIETFKPQDETVEAVREWLIAAGIHPARITHSENKAWLAFDATTKEAEELLQTEYHSYQHKNGHMSVACDQYVTLKDALYDLSLRGIGLDVL